MSEQQNESVNFEKELARLQEIVDKIEGNVLQLDESIKLYEEGTKIIKKLEGALKDAEGKMAKIIEAK